MGQHVISSLEIPGQFPMEILGSAFGWDPRQISIGRNCPSKNEHRFLEGIDQLSFLEHGFLVDHQDRPPSSRGTREESMGKFHISWLHPWTPRDISPEEIC